MQILNQERGNLEIKLSNYIRYTAAVVLIGSVMGYHTTTFGKKLGEFVALRDAPYKLAQEYISWHNFKR